MKTRSLILALSAFAAIPFVTAATEIKMLGSTTVFLTVVKDFKDAVAGSTHTTITATAATSGKGFAALQAGQVDVALSTDSLAGLADGLKAKGTPINPADYVEFPIKTTYLVTVCHRSNTVPSLSADQIKGILTGQIRNWKEVGGSDAPIAIWYEREDSGNYGLLKRVLLKDAPLATHGLNYVNNSRFIARNVSEVPTAIGLSSDLYIDDTVRMVPGFKIEQNLCFITKKDPSPELLKVIDAFRQKVK